MTVTRATLRTSAWDTIYTYLQTTNAISTNNIFSAWNSTLASDKGYPLVIIHSPTASFNKLNVTGVLTESELNFFIEIYHTSAQNCKALADEVTAKLLAGRSTFAGQRMMNMQIDGGDEDTWQEGKAKKIHRISFNVTFRYVSQ